LHDGDSRGQEVKVANLPGERDVAVAEPVRTIQALDRGLRLLTIIAESPQPLSRSEVARLAGLNPSTAFRLLVTLESHGLIERVPGGGGYRRGVATLLLAAGGIEEAIRRHARPLLEILRDATGESAVVSAVGTASFAPLEQIDGIHALSVRWIGRRFPLNCTSPGKLVLAALSEAELDACLAGPVEACTPLTLTDPAAIRAELAEVRRTGIATSVGDHELGVIGISAAARDAAGRPVAIISVTGPDVRLTTARLGAIAPLVRSAAGELARALDATERR
jgi:IclR family KDG regulon transcriptional repressor